jgi:hypothetical protein
MGTKSRDQGLLLELDGVEAIVTQIEELAMDGLEAAADDDRARELRYLETIGTICGAARAKIEEICDAVRADPGKVKAKSGDQVAPKKNEKVAA